MSKVPSLLLALLLIAACSPTANNTSHPPASITTPIETQPQTTEILPSPTVMSSNTQTLEIGSCVNRYFPVREGAHWFYESKGGLAGDTFFNEAITSVREDGFTLTSNFGASTRVQEWACTSRGLVALQLGGEALRSQNLKLEALTNTASGVTYPKAIAAGDQWDYTLDFTGKMEVAGNPGDAAGKQKIHFTALGMESVTVPVGPFDALKIQVDTTLDITVTTQGKTTPVQFSSSYIYWYVQDFGWVKARGTGSLSGSSFSEAIELISYNFP